ncbi:hypothetical protein [Limosilactobacillus vaginalis]|uniref:hypothetical protein n=1 Tax=Limosilactobacillus vaginalis TaxID=1633 RepID=UPI0024B9C642|nr:hypothetical protein [Limosilactobacillus vaginalis]
MWKAGHIILFLPQPSQSDWAFLFGGIHMNLLNGFDSYMIYKLLANLFHTSIEQVYWSLTVGGLIVVVIIFAIYYLVGRGFK